MAVQANRKEFYWRSMNDAEKAEFKIAAEQAWSVWKENDAVEELSPEESQRVRERLKREGQQGKILTPRYVFTDKHEGLRTEQNKLPLRARARIVCSWFQGHLFIWTSKGCSYMFKTGPTFPFDLDGMFQCNGCWS